jgi:hypothetical protein
MIQPNVKPVELLLSGSRTSLGWLGIISWIKTLRTASPWPKPSPIIWPETAAAQSPQGTLLDRTVPAGHYLERNPYA